MRCAGKSVLTRGNKKGETIEESTTNNMADGTRCDGVTTGRSPQRVVAGEAVRLPIPVDNLDAGSAGYCERNTGRYINR